jgi:DNA-directed RNA polymerase specialized sigma24 family protein
VAHWGFDAWRTRHARAGTANAMTNEPTALPQDAPPGPQEARHASLFGELYRDLHRLAARQLRRNGGSTLSATTLLHEAYMDISRRGNEFPDRARFFAYAARAMRGLVIDYVRERRAQKRGGAFHLTALDTGIAEATPGART